MGSVCSSQGKQSLKNEQNYNNKNKIIAKNIENYNKMYNQKDLYSLFSQPSNTQYGYAFNLKNLEKLKYKYGPPNFYGNFVMSTCKFAQDFQKNKKQFQILKQFKSSSLEITRLQCCQLICLMMLQSFKQTTQNTNNCVNFSTLFQQYHGNRNESNLGKLDCIYNYILIMAENENNKSLMDEKIIIKRKYIDKKPKLTEKMSVVQIDTQNPIQYYKDCAQVDFANEFVGGGILRNGSLQEEILFSTCPEMIVSLLFVERLKQNESIIFQNIYQYTKHTGYASQFKFQERNYNFKLPLEIIAIDSVDYSKQPYNIQYQKQMIQREFLKAYSGFSGASQNIIATGNWGCGAFKSDPQLKFIIQWLACSQSQKQMIYCTFREQKLRNVEEIILLFENKQVQYVMELVNMLQQNSQYTVFEQLIYYNKCNDKNKINNPSKKISKNNKSSNIQNYNFDNNIEKIQENNNYENSFNLYKHNKNKLDQNSQESYIQHQDNKQHIDIINNNNNQNDPFINQNVTNDLNILKNNSLIQLDNEEIDTFDQKNNKNFSGNNNIQNTENNPQNFDFQQDKSELKLQQEQFKQFEKKQQKKIQQQQLQNYNFENQENFQQNLNIQNQNDQKMKVAQRISGDNQVENKGYDYPEESKIKPSQHDQGQINDRNLLDTSITPQTPDLYNNMNIYNNNQKRFQEYQLNDKQINDNNQQILDQQNHQMKKNNNENNLVNQKHQQSIPNQNFNENQQTNHHQQEQFNLNQDIKLTNNQIKKQQAKQEINEKNRKAQLKIQKDIYLQEEKIKYTQEEKNFKQQLNTQQYQQQYPYYKEYSNKDIKSNT